MKFKVDENLPVELAEFLRKEKVDKHLWILEEDRIRIRS